MNNTFCLGIFLILVFARELSWTFSAETISIFTIQVTAPPCFAQESACSQHSQVLILFMSFKKTHTMLNGIVILLFYPAALALVALLENVAGLD